MDYVEQTKEETICYHILRNKAIGGDKMTADIFFVNGKFQRCLMHIIKNGGGKATLFSDGADIEEWKFISDIALHVCDLEEVRRMDGK